MPLDPRVRVYGDGAPFVPAARILLEYNRQYMQAFKLQRSTLRRELAPGVVVEVISSFDQDYVTIIAKPGGAGGRERFQSNIYPMLIQDYPTTQIAGVNAPIVFFSDNGSQWNLTTPLSAGSFLGDSSIGDVYNGTLVFAGNGWVFGMGDFNYNPANHQFDTGLFALNLRNLADGWRPIPFPPGYVHWSPDSSLNPNAQATYIGGNTIALSTGVGVCFYTFPSSDATQGTWRARGRAGAATYSTDSGYYLSVYTLETSGAGVVITAATLANCQGGSLTDMYVSRDWGPVALGTSNYQPYALHMDPSNMHPLGDNIAGLYGYIFFNPVDGAYYSSTAAPLASYALTIPEPGARVVPLGIDPVSNQRVLICAGVTCQSVHYFRSTDGGGTWTPVSGIPAMPAKLAVPSLGDWPWTGVCFLGNGNVVAAALLVSGQTDIYRSIDNGATWTHVVALPSKVTLNDTGATWPFTFTGKYLILEAVTLTAPQSYISSDLGQTWAPFNAPAYCMNFSPAAGILGLARQQGNSGAQNVVSVSIEGGVSILYAGCSGDLYMYDSVLPAHTDPKQNPAIPDLYS